MDHAAYLTGFTEETDPDGEWRDFPDPLQTLAARGLRTARLEIAPLRAGWKTALPPEHYRSGAGPIEALRDARDAVRTGSFDAVLIHGEERLRTGYGREERHRLMAIYPGHSIPDAYDLVARAWCGIHRVQPDEFTLLADALLENHRAVAGKSSRTADPRWLEPLTPLQRGVDCANPLVDWRGQLLVAGRAALEAFGEDPAKAVRLAGVGFERLPVDGPAHAGEIARFDHLERALARAEEEAGARVADLVIRDLAALEIYTCYPVVPLAFLLKARLAEQIAHLPALLARAPITLTGGMNLARAPWNLPALRGLVRVGETVRLRRKPYGVVHGNGGAGYSQGVAILHLPNP